MSLFLDIVAVAAAILGGWGALGIGAKALGVSSTVKEGMRAVSKGIAEVCGITASQQINNIYVIDEWQLNALTDKLKPFFSYLVFESAFSNNDFLKVVYVCGVLEVDLKVIEQEFRNFLRQQFNLSANEPLFTWAYIENGRLMLVCAFSDEGRIWLQTQKNNERSRQIPNNIDLIE